MCRNNSACNRKDLSRCFLFFVGSRNCNDATKQDSYQKVEMDETTNYSTETAEYLELNVDVVFRQVAVKAIGRDRTIFASAHRLYRFVHLPSG